MRLEAIHEGKAIILSPEAYAFAKHVAEQAYKRYQLWYNRIKANDPEVTNINQYRDQVTEELVLHTKLLPKKMPVEILVTYHNSNHTEGKYDPSSADWSEIIEIELKVGCKNPKLAQPFLEEVLIHEMTHAVDPKVSKMIPKTHAAHDATKIRGGDMAEFWKYARQPIEVEAVFYQIANRFIRHFKSLGLSKDQIINKIRYFTPDVVDEVYKTHVYGEKLKILLGRKSYRRKFMNTLLYIANLQESTSKQRRLTEADMSRRQFLKTMGKGAMAAAAPKQALKGLMGGTKKAATNIMPTIPKTPSAMRTALIKWMKDNNLEQRWLKYYKEDQERNETTKEEFEKVMAQRKAAGGQYFKGSYEDYLKWLANDYVDTFRSELLNLAEPSYDEPAYLEDLQHVLDTYDNERFTDGMPIPEWVTRYRVSQFMGRDVGMDHPFVQDREQWLKHFYTGIYNVPDPKVEEQFINIIKTSTSPERYKDLFGIDDPKPTLEKDKPKPKPEEPKRIDSDEPDSWRTQSVEFEHKLVARLRRL